ncbi:MAG: GDSL-type esterase/lipase family protein [Schaedlerella sp.]|nr:GDSL-type esterase/lipase family protein [Schaedlerella sp.]
MKKIWDFIEANKKRILIIAGILLVILLLAISFISWKKNEERKARIQKGISYLESLETKDVSEINSKVKSIKAELNLAYASDNEDEVWIGFEDAVIIGDSRAVGFSYYGFLSESQVLAEKGAIITGTADRIDQLKSLNPGQIFLCFGLNDIQRGLWDEPESYSEQCAEIIELLNEELPQCEVFLNSILPAGEVAIASTAKYAEIDDYNASLAQMCEEKGVNFVDNTAVANEHMDLYEPDGLHLQSEFYKYWAANMLLEVE